MRAQHKKTVLIFSLIFCSFLKTGFLFAGDTYSYWEIYKQALTLFQQNKQNQEVADLCNDVRKNATDDLLIARSIFLLAEFYTHNSNTKDALKVVSELFESKNLPEQIKDEARLKAGLILLQENQREQAVALFQEIARSSGNNFTRQEARLTLAGLYIKNGLWQQSDSLLQLISTEQPAYAKNERLLVLQARFAIATGQADNAISILADCNSSDALLYLAQAYELVGKPIMAVGVYKKIHDLFPNTPAAEDALFNAGEVFMRSQDWLAARNQFNRMLQSFSETNYKERLFFRMGWIHLKLNQFDDAIAYFNKPVPLESQSYFSYMGAESLNKQGGIDSTNFQKAIIKYNSISAIAPNSPMAPTSKFKAALTMLNKNAADQAVIALKQFLALYPKDPIAPAATFLLAVHASGATKEGYFKTILQKYPNGIYFDTALYALQNQDYANQKFQDIINRFARTTANDSTVLTNEWQRKQQLLLAEAYYYSKQYDQAIQTYSRVIYSDQQELAELAELGQAWCVLQSGKIDSAATLFAQQRKLFTGENYARASFGLATAYFRSKQYEQAIRTFPLALNSNEGQQISLLLEKSLYYVGESYYRLEYYGEAIEAWQKLVAEFPTSDKSPEAQFKVADTYFRANHFDEAMTAFQVIVDNYRNHPLATESLLKLGQCEFNAGRYNAALAIYQDFIQRNPQNPKYRDALEGIQLCYYQLGQTEQASEVLEKLIAQAPNDALSADARFRLAQNYLNAQETDKAIEAFKEILTLHPGTSYAMDAQFALAQTYFSKGDYTNSNSEFSRFLQYFPESQQTPEVLFNLGVGYFNQQSYLSASDYFDQIIKSYETSQFYNPALQNLGWCFDRLGEQSRALEYFSLYLSKNPAAEDREKISLQAARIQADIGSKDSALAALQKLKSSTDKSVTAEAAYRLGTIYLEANNWEQARNAFRYAIQHGARQDYYRLSSLSQLGAMFESEKSWKQAVAAYQLLADTAPEEAWVTAALEKVNALTPLVAQ